MDWESGTGRYLYIACPLHDASFVTFADIDPPMDISQVTSWEILRIQRRAQNGRQRLDRYLFNLSDVASQSGLVAVSHYNIRQRSVTTVLELEVLAQDFRENASFQYHAGLAVPTTADVPVFNQAIYDLVEDTQARLELDRLEAARESGEWPPLSEQ
jgi:hypothetical protein